MVVPPQPVVPQENSAPVQKDNQLPDLVNQSDTDTNKTTSGKNNKVDMPIDNKKTQITPATFDGNGVVVQGKNLSGTYVAFIHPISSTGKILCREMITPSCVLQKTVSTDTTIKFISNWIDGEGLYQIYVENETTGESNKVNMTISALKK